MLFETISADVKTAMKAKNAVEVLTLRTLLADIRNMQIKRFTEEAKKNQNVQRNQEEVPTDEDVFAVLVKNIKQMEDNLEIFVNSKRDDLLLMENTKIAIYKKYLPLQMSDDELTRIVDNVLKIVSGKSPKEIFGAAMKSIMPMIKGKADGNAVSQIVKQKLGL
jgi:uncharacterized protein YqeY